jgi:hypothetical protein
MAIRDGTFSFPYPALGTPHKDQLDILRTNSEEISTTALASILDIDDGDNLNRALAGLMFGQPGFKNKFRWFYDKATGDITLARNTGTAGTPTWVSTLVVNSVGQITTSIYSSSLFGTPVDTGDANDTGVSTLFARSDHVHKTKNLGSLLVKLNNTQVISDTSTVAITELTNLTIPGANGVKNFVLYLNLAFNIEPTRDINLFFRVGPLGTIADPIIYAYLVEPTNHATSSPTNVRGVGPIFLTAPATGSKLTLACNFSASDPDHKIAGGVYPYTALEIREVPV